ncbi:hypothetical protein CIL05_20205 [Virgibacillus profundi]|uniref:Uncharacterized protein n=1 Tax=Virgibacillus profundi TaxID=2024555 RepID=A0A2A2I897_9BACI|nr:hypothetical protein [Virgibacillus profundi]PAV27802.1 hypothetical protein CIL05_20205 [Virgibacillus profundi]PXY52024.1 hypothetical protein CIT14_20185 [Virgibacillus profundi]
MLNEPVVAAMLLLALLAVGEYLSIISKARIPMLLVALFGYLILIWTGIFPKDLIDRSNLAVFGAVMVAPLIVHMGTLVPFRLIKGQVKAILIALFGVICSTVLIILVVSPIFGYEAAVSGAGPLSGGLIATLITFEKLEEIGLAAMVTIPALVYGCQKLFGMPIASNLLRRYALKLRASIDAGTFTAAEKSKNNVSATAKENEKSLLPEKYQTSIILLFQLFIGGALAVWLESLTGIHYSLWALFIGITGTFFGFYQPRIMQRANTFGISMVGLLLVVISAMNDITVGMFVDYLPTILLILAVGATGILAGGFIASKVLKWDPFLGVPVALTAMFGFPADYILAEEVSRSVGRNEEEQQVILDSILTPMLVGGFTTVTTASILIASILMGTL